MRSYLLVLSAAATLVACGDNLQGDQPPTVTGRAITTAEDTATTFTVDASDPENEGLTFTASTPAHGTITVAGASLTYTPDADYHGDDAVTVTVSDGSFSASAAVAITVTPVNDAPVAEDDAVATSEDVPAVIAGTTLVANDTDVDGDPLTVSAVGTASAGTVVLAAGTVTYTPPLDFTGDATFTYTVSDGTASAMATVTVAVGGANDPPVATDDTVTTAEDTAATIPAATLLANDTDAEGQTLTVTAVAGATNGTVALAGTTVTFTPTADFSGAATFTYTVSDGADTDTGTVTVTVTPVNDGPVAVADTATTAEDTVATIPAATLLANDSDVESTPTVTAVSGATNGTVALAGTTVTFTPAANFNGAAGFDYTISDGTLTATARVTVTVTPVNDGPVAVADAVTTAEDTAAVIAAATLLTNDTDVDGPSLTITAVTGATGGTVALAGTTVTFTPTANTSGTGGFDYTISDGTLTSTARVTVTVTPVNDAPVAVADTVTTAEDTVATIAAATLLANDSDPDGTPTITAVSNATSGTVSLAGTTITFTPAANFSGAAGFDYTISDGTLTATAHVTVTVTPVNDAPVAVADTVTTAEDTVATIAAATLLANDSDPDGTTPTISAVSNATGGTVSLAGTTITFTPTANFSGTAGFDYTITDGTLTATAHVTVSVTAANDAPVATDDTVTTAEDTVATIAAATLLANDSDPDGTTPTISAVSAATNGTVALAGTTITFTPTADFSGTAGFDYTITDGTLTATAHVTVTVTPVNDGPVAVDDFTSTNQDTPAIIPDASLLANDTDVDGPALTVSAVSNPTNGTVTHVGTTVTFTPTTGFTGTAGFDYTITDGTLTSTAHVTVSVGNVNDAPVAVADAVSTDEDTAAVISGATLTGNDTDPDSDPLFVSAVSNPTNGTVTLVLGVVTFTPTADFFGTAGFDYTVSDGFLTSTAHVTVTVNSIDDLPVAVDDNAFTQEDLGVFIDVLTNDTGLGDGGVSITATTNGAHGSVSTGGTNVLYLPEANYAGTDTFTYTLTDADGDTATATVTVTLGAQNDAPVANGQSVATNAGTPVTITLTATDVDSPSVTFAVGTPPAGGTLGPITPTGAFTATVLYTNNAGFSGSDPFTFTANDGALTSAPATVTVNVILVRPTIVATVPAAGALGVRAAAPVTVTFSLAMDPATLTAQTADGACTGSIQLSADGFATCLGFTTAAPVMTGANTIATLAPTAALATLGVYQVRVDASVASATGVTLNTTFTQSPGFTIATDGVCAGSLVISQVFGGNTGTVINADYVELHNPTASPISTNGMAIQYASATGTSWSPRALPNAVIPPGGYYLIRTTTPAGSGAALPTPDFITATTMEMAGAAGKIVLTPTATALPPTACPINLTLDFVGYGTTANCAEGGTTPTPAPSTSLAVFRGGAGCTDNNVNSTDFATGAPAPRNSATAPLVCSCAANETDRVAELDFCNLQFPATLNVTAGQSTPLVYGRVFEAGLTNIAGASAQLRAEVGYGAAGIDPATTPGFLWTPSIFNVQIGNDDEYQGSFTAPAAGSYGYATRFSRDGTNWTYCDLNGAGSNGGLTFEAAQLGVLTTTP